MKKRRIGMQEYAAELFRALPAGALMTAADGEKVNPMVIGWGTVGICWRKPICIVFVRESRFTRECLEANPEFTVNIPAGKPDPKVISVCGSRSGRDMDKIGECGLTPVKAEKVSVPAIREFPVTLECRVVYSQMQDPEKLDDGILGMFYPAGPDGTKRDEHIAYYGEILDAYVLED